jgi:2-methyl-3-hydroxypyridine 5-carboxylic acid dioxygenase
MVNAFTLARAVDGANSVDAAVRSWEEKMRPLTDRCQARSAHYAATRSMSQGNQFSHEVLETARYDPITDTFI